ncbi:MAG: four-carbon acid sugar kinase family protein [bacterium]|jgi:uncharacterized protein YgbK (DUF1537 family)
MTAPLLRLLADDLTGALDTAAEMTGLCGPVPVRWDAAPLQASAAFSSGSREAPRDAAIKAVRAFTPLLAGADIAYRKLDSLLRGNVAAELAACWATGFWRHCVLAPAFPAQGRIARDGKLWARRADGAFAPITMPDWSAENLFIHHGLSSQSLRDGITWFDADSDEDLAQITALADTAKGPILWAGSGGLARALAGDARTTFQTDLQAPVLGLFGSDQIVTARQLAACGSTWLCIHDASEAPRIAAQLATGAALVSITLPDGMPRSTAAQRIAGIFADLLRSLPRPGTLIVAGGETLRAICDALGADGSVATGLVAPGVPRSILQGGAWDGLPVISKSGAFGQDALLRDLLAANHLPSGSIAA